jgi:hypothetical protein
LVHDFTRRPSTQSTTASTQENSIAGTGYPDENSTTRANPGLQSLLSGLTHRNRALLFALAKYSDRRSVPIQIGQVKCREFTDSNPGRIQQLHDGHIAQCNGRAAGSYISSGIQDHHHVIGTHNFWQRAMRLGRGKSRAGVFNN